MNTAYKFSLTLLLASSLCLADKNNVVPVMVGSNDNLDACSGLGVVTGLKSKRHGFLAVRAGPSQKFEIVDKLKASQKVYICSSSEDGKWYGVVYSPNQTDECGVTSPINPTQPYKGKCKSGWVNDHWIKLVAG